LSESGRTSGTWRAAASLASIFFRSAPSGVDLLPQRRVRRLGQARFQLRGRLWRRRQLRHRNRRTSHLKGRQSHQHNPSRLANDPVFAPALHISSPRTASKKILHVNPQFLLLLTWMGGIKIHPVHPFQVSRTISNRRERRETQRKREKPSTTKTAKDTKEKQEHSSRRGAWAQRKTQLNTEECPVGDWNEPAVLWLRPLQGRASSVSARIPGVSLRLTPG
jgi:hypothetical protein